MVIQSAASVSEWEALASATFVPVHVEARFAGLPATMDHRGDLVAGISAIRGGAGRVVRTRDLLDSSRDDIALFSLQLRGSSRVEQGDRQARIAPGNGVLYLTRSPYELTFPDPIDLAILQLPSELLGLGADSLEALTATPVHVRQDAALRTLARVVRSLFTDRPVIANENEALRTAADILGSALRQRRGMSSPARSHSALFAAFDRAISERLDDPRLDVTALASMENVSVRTVHQVFAERGTAPAAHIRAARMRRAKRLLTSTNLRLVDIAIRCGSSDPSVFSRTFRHDEGTTPSEYRRRMQRPADPDRAAGDV
jgi:AraC-like DNA-binding protein